MALQGTFDTFALADVLRLLGGTAKSGQLHITGEGPNGAVTGDIWLESGRLVDIDTPEPAGSLAEGLFQLLRVDGGAFTFDPDGRSDSDLDAAEVSDVIGEAQEMLGEWTDVRRSLPSLDHDLMLVGTLESDSVTLSAAQWAAVAAVASDRSARAVADRLKLGALGLGRIVRDLRELGVIHVSMETPESAFDLPDVRTPLRLTWSDDPLELDLDEPVAAAPSPTPALVHIPAPVAAAAAPSPAAPPVAWPAPVAAAPAVAPAPPSAVAPMPPAEPVVADPRPLELGDLTSSGLSPIEPGADRLMTTGRFSLFTRPDDEPAGQPTAPVERGEAAALPVGAGADVAGVEPAPEPVVPSGSEPVVDDAREDELAAAFASPPVMDHSMPPKRRMRLRAVRS